MSWTFRFEFSLYFGALGRDGALQLIAGGINSNCSQLAGRRPLEGQLKLKVSGWMWYGGYVRSCRTFWVTGVALPKTEGLRCSNAFSKTAKTVECCTRQIQNILEQARFLQNKMWNSETRIACVFESSSLIPANHKDICVLHDSSCSGDVSIPFIFHVLFPLQRESLISLSPWVSSRIITRRETSFSGRLIHTETILLGHPVWRWSYKN